MVTCKGTLFWVSHNMSSQFAWSGKCLRTVGTFVWLLPSMDVSMCLQRYCGGKTLLTMLTMVRALTCDTTKRSQWNYIKFPKKKGDSWCDQVQLNIHIILEEVWKFRNRCFFTEKLDASLSVQPFLSQMWLMCNFSHKYPYNIKQTGNKNTQTNLAEDVLLNKQ